LLERRYIYENHTIIGSMKQSSKALRWIVNIFRKNGIPFQVVGGLAAKAYGATRKLHDIDIYVPDKHMNTIINQTKEFIIWGPKRIKIKKLGFGIYKNKICRTVDRNWSTRKNQNI